MIETEYYNPHFLQELEKKVKKNFKYSIVFPNKEIYDTILSVISSKVFLKNSLVFSTYFVDSKEENNYLLLFSKYLEKNNKIKQLFISLKLLNLSNSKILCSILNGLPKLKQLSLRFQTFTAEGIENLKNIDNKLNFLDISNSQLKMQGLSKLLLLLNKLESLKSLDLSNNFFAEKSCKILCDFLKIRQNIINLNISNNYFNNNDMKNFCDSIRESSNLKSLSIRNIRLSYEGVQHIADYLSNNNSLTLLDLSGSKLTSKEIELMVDRFKGNTKLKKLILNKNEIRDEGFIKIACVQNRKMYIEVKDCYITDKGVEQVLNYIDDKSFNKKLMLSIGENNFSEVVIKRILSKIKYSDYLKLE